MIESLPDLSSRQELLRGRLERAAPDASGDPCGVGNGIRQCGPFVWRSLVGWCSHGRNPCIESPWLFHPARMMLIGAQRWTVPVSEPNEDGGKSPGGARLGVGAGATRAVGPVRRERRRTVLASSLDCRLHEQLVCFRGPGGHLRVSLPGGQLRGSRGRHSKRDRGANGVERQGHPRRQFAVRNR